MVFLNTNHVIMSDIQILDGCIDKFKNQNFNNNNYILIADKQNVDTAIRLSLLSKIIQKKNNANMLVLTDKKKHLSLKIYEMFNIKKIYISFQIKDFFSNIFFSIHCSLIYFTLMIKFAVDKNLILNFIDDFKFYNIHVGDLIYDTYIRNDHSFLNFNIFNLKFLKIFFKTLFRLKKIKSLFDLYKIEVVVSSGLSFNFGGTLAIRYASKMGCKTYVHADILFKEIKSYDMCQDSVFKVYKEELLIFKKNENKINVDNFINKRFFKNSYSGNFVQIDTFKKAYFNSKNINRFDFIQNLTKNTSARINDENLLNLIALNCFSDAPRSFSKSGIFLFQDYYDFFVKSIEAISKLDKKNIWLIKPHPANLEYGEGGIIEELLEKYNLENVFMCPKNINNKNYFNIIDNLITSRSTIALEYACFGGKPIICGSTPYNGLGFTHEPQSINEYYNILKNLNFNNKLNDEEKNNARATLYILDHVKMEHLEKSIILPSRKDLENIDRRLFNDEYFKKIKITLNERKIHSFFDDPYYKSLELLVNNLRVTS